MLVNQTGNFNPIPSNPLARANTEMLEQAKQERGVESDGDAELVANVTSIDSPRWGIKPSRLEQTLDAGRLEMGRLLNPHVSGYARFFQAI